MGHDLYQDTDGACFCECWNCQNDDCDKCKYGCQVADAYRED